MWSGFKSILNFNLANVNNMHFYLNFRFAEIEEETTRISKSFSNNIVRITLLLFQEGSFEFDLKKLCVKII